MRSRKARTHSRKACARAEQAEFRERSAPDHGRTANRASPPGVVLLSGPEIGEMSRETADDRPSGGRRAPWSRSLRRRRSGRRLLPRHGGSTGGFMSRARSFALWTIWTSARRNRPAVSRIQSRSASRIPTSNSSNGSGRDVRTRRARTADRCPGTGHAWGELARTFSSIRTTQSAQATHGEDADIRRVRAALAEPSPEDRSLLILRDVKGHSYEGIAVTLSVQQCAARMLRTRARPRLRRALERTPVESRKWPWQR